MSLINDALKRAKQAQNPAPPPDLPFKAAEPAAPRNAGLPLLPLAALVVALVLGGVFILMALQKRNAAPTVVHAAQPEITSAPTLSLAAPTSAAVALAPGTVPAQPQSPSATQAADSPSGSTPETTPEPPAVPKLQGIFYNPSRPSAVVSGKTVYVGSRVGEGREFLVLEITRESVTVGNGSQTNVLVLGE